MTPKKYFDAVWMRCDNLSSVHAFMANKATQIVMAEEILRAEWVARVSALDLYVHELVCQRMLNVFLGKISKPKKFSSFQLPIGVIDEIRDATTNCDAGIIFDREVRRQLSFVTYQYPERIADGIRMCSDVELWGDIALHQSGSLSNKDECAKKLKKTLCAIVDRRNKIAHEGDMQPMAPKAPWPISQKDLMAVSEFIKKLVDSMEVCVK